MSMLNIGKSGLLASMAALNATSNNVANAMVAGYSRQQVMLSSVGGGAWLWRGCVCGWCSADLRSVRGRPIVANHECRWLF